MKTKPKRDWKDSLPDYHIRWMIRRDMAEVLEIEQTSFINPWTEDDFIKVLRKRCCIAMVVECAERVVGFMVYELQRHRIVLLNLAVKQDCRLLGVGRAMIDKLAGKLVLGRRERICMFIRERSLDAQLFLRAVGFQADPCMIDVIDKETGEREHGLWFESNLIEPGLAVMLPCEGEDGECRC